MTLRAEYKEHLHKKKAFVFILLISTVFLSIISLHLGSSGMTIKESLLTLFGNGEDYMQQIVYQIRLPRVLSGIFVGMSIALSGLIIQSSLNNPLASPSTIGISAASAAGANIALILFARIGIERSIYLTALTSFFMAMVCMVFVLSVSYLRKSSKTTIILAGTAFHSLFLALITLLQYFADDTELAAAVAWTFGDLGRMHFTEVYILITMTVISFVLVYALRWQMNAMDMGEQAAHSLGIATRKLRNFCIVLAALNTGVCVAFSGIIGFVGLLSPQITKRIIGEDKRYMIPASMLLGANITIFSDCIARTIAAPLILPVGALTSLLGAPLFLYILLKEG